ncbi:MAG: DUF2497 domain-containing protein [Alphaproteobacteria bacterium]
MAEAKTQQEPTMEEILASIRRIISEDEPAGTSAAPAEDAKEGQDVVELTNVVEERPPVAPTAAEPVMEPVAPAAAAENGQGENELEPPADDGGKDDRLVSEATAAAASGALSELASAVGGRSHKGLSLGAGDRTIEEIVRELLRPMLQQWLEANLPTLVQRLVQREIKAMVRRAEDS